MSNFSEKKYSFIVVSLIMGFILFSSAQLKMSHHLNAVFETTHFPPDSIIDISDSTVTYPLSKETGITGRIIAGNIIAINYNRLLTEQPNINWVALWQGSQIHYNEKPLRKMSISNLQQSGSFNFDSLSLSTLKYIVGFGLGDSISGATSTLFFAKGTTEGTPFSTQITLREYAPTSLIYDFVTPIGNLPSDNKNWVGLWKGKSIDFKDTNLLKRANVKLNISEGSGGLNDLSLENGSWYTLTYATGPTENDICASFTFQTK